MTIQEQVESVENTGGKKYFSGKIKHESFKTGKTVNDISLFK